MTQSSTTTASASTSSSSATPNTMMNFKRIDLFGGAMTCEIPSEDGWRDVSDVRQIPSHQECWQQIQQENDDVGGGRVLVIEILQFGQRGDLMVI